MWFFYIHTGILANATEFVHCVEVLVWSMGDNLRTRVCVQWSWPFRKHKHFLYVYRCAFAYIIHEWTGWLKTESQYKRTNLVLHSNSRSIMKFFHAFSLSSWSRMGGQRATQTVRFSKPSRATMMSSLSDGTPSFGCKYIGKQKYIYCNQSVMMGLKMKWK